MKIGVFHLRGDSSSDPAVIARRAEELGFESYWVGHHTIYPATSASAYPGRTSGEQPDYLVDIPDPFMCLARAGAVTSTIRLGTAVWLAAEHDPLLAAMQVATLDEHTGGRVLFGVGAGWNAEESAIFGVDFANRWEQVEDYVAAMKSLWTDDPSEHRGKYVSFPPVHAFPKPVSKPHPPILLGSTGSRKALERAARWADGWVPVIHDVPRFADDVRLLREHLRSADRDPGGFTVTAFGVEGQWRTTEEIRELEQAGADRVLIWLHQAPQEEQLEDLEALAATHLTD